MSRAGAVVCAVVLALAAPAFAAEGSGVAISTAAPADAPVAVATPAAGPAPSTLPAGGAVRAATEEGSATVNAPPRLRVHVGALVGFPFVVGVQGLATLFADGAPRFDVDLSWEPTNQLQSYSLGGAWQVLDRAFFVGARVRLLQYQPPWGHGPAQLYPGVGGELGARFRVGGDGQGVVTVMLHGAVVPAQATNLGAFFGLTAGFAWSVFSR